MTQTVNPSDSFPPPRTYKWGQISRDRLIQIAVSVLTVTLVLAPILPILYQSVLDRPLYEADGQFTLQNYVNLATAQGFGPVLWNTFKRLTAGASATEKRALFAGTAARVYGLEALLQ